MNELLLQMRFQSDELKLYWVQLKDIDVLGPGLLRESAALQYLDQVEMLLSYPITEMQFRCCRT